MSSDQQQKKVVWPDAKGPWPTPPNDPFPSLAEQEEERDLYSGRQMLQESRRRGTRVDKIPY